MKNRFPLVMHNGESVRCTFCGSQWGVDAVLDYRFGHTEQQARAYGWLNCCGMCYARVMTAAYCNRPDQKPKGYRGYRP